MAQTTTNYKLPLVPRDEKAMTFLEWRVLVNGTEQGSAMQMIDGYLKDLQSSVDAKAAGFTYDATTGVLQLVDAAKTPISGASVTIKLNDYYTKEDMAEVLKSFHTKEEITQIINSIDYSSFYTKEEVDGAFATKNNTYTKDDVKQMIDEIDVTSQLTDYAKKADLDNYVKEADLESKLEDIDLSGYVKEEDFEQTLSENLESLASNTKIGLDGDETIAGINQRLKDVESEKDELAISVQRAFVDYNYDEDEHKLSFVRADNTSTSSITITGGGGGGGMGYSVRLVNGLSSTSVTTSYGSTLVLPFTFYQYYGNQIEAQDGTYTVEYKLATEPGWNTLFRDQKIQHGVTTTCDVTNLLRAGSVTSVRITATSGSDNTVSRELQYTITCVDISISTTYDETMVYTGNFNFPYRCIGKNIRKTLYFYIDGELYQQSDIGTSNNEARQLPINLVGNYEYGAHSARVYFVTDDGAYSNELVFPIFYDDGTSKQPMIGAYLDSDDIDFGETLKLNYIVYTPDQETTSSVHVEIGAFEDNHLIPKFDDTLTNIPNNKKDTLPIQSTSYPEQGRGYIELTSGETEVILYFNVNEVTYDFDINQVTTNLVYSYRPVGATNNSAGKETYVYEYTDSTNEPKKIYAKMTGFNWVSDGYLGDNALTLNGSAKMNINLPILSSRFTNEDKQEVILDSGTNAHVTSSGRTIEFEFELSNVTSFSKTVFSCMSEQNAGFVITPQVCYLLSSGQALQIEESGFIHNEESVPCAYLKDDKRIRVTFVIQALSTFETRATQCVNIFINGEYANSYLYPTNANYDSTATITIGSDACTTKLYDIRMYNRALTKEEVLKNYMNAPLDIRERIANNELNDLLDNTNNVSYKKAITMYPCLLVIGPYAPYKLDTTQTSRPNCGFVLTKPDGKGGYKIEFSMLDQDENGNFLSSNNVQGTSSQKFMRKNYKCYLVAYDRDEKGNIKIGEDGKRITKKVKYAIDGYDSAGKALSTPESTLCFKMDYMSTDHANTFNANIADTLFNDKESGSMVQNTIHGFRCLMFHMEMSTYKVGAAINAYDEADIEFAGDGCLNNDKGNTKSFGLESAGDKDNVTKQQKWEFKNNTNDICFFKTDKFFEPVDSDSKYQVVDALESCYPDQGDLKKDGFQPNYDYIQTLWTWVSQRANFWDATTTTGTYTYNGKTYRTEREYKKAIFYNEFTKHFNLEHALVYYLFIEWVALCDNRAKNMFISCKDVTVEKIAFTGGASSIADIRNAETGAIDTSKINWEQSTFGIWYTDLYDLDSCFGAENSGYIRIPYYADWDYVLDDKGYQFNGHDSVFWLMFEEAFAAEIKERAKALTRDSATSGFLNYDLLKKVHITENAELVSPAVVNRDMEYKYEDAWTQGYYDYSETTNPTSLTYSAAYKYLQRGSRTEQKESFIYKRSRMLYSKYQCDQFEKDTLTFRAGKTVTRAKSVITATLDQTMYWGVKYGDSGTTTMSDKIEADTPVTITSPTQVGNSDTVYLCAASNLTSISSIAEFNPYELQLERAKKLKTLIVGATDDDEYRNGRLSAVDTSNNTLLETINIRGCSGIQSPIDMTKNTLIKHVYAKNSSVPYFTFVDGGILETLELGEPQRILLQNMTNLKDFSYTSLNNLTQLRVEYTPDVKVFPMLHERFDNLHDGIRLMGINEDLSGYDWAEEVLEKLASDDAKGRYLDDKGLLSNDKNAYPVITGDVYVTEIGSTLKGRLAVIYPDLNIHAEIEIVQTRINFENWNGDLLYVEYVSPTNYPDDPVAKGWIDTPTRPTSDEATYTYAGWDRPFTTAGSTETTYTATYTSDKRKYKVEWYVNNVLKDSKEVEYGESAEYEGETPTSAARESLGEYQLFKDWDQFTGYVTSDIKVNALFYSASAPANGKKIGNMEPIEIYALERAGVLSSSGGANNSPESPYYQMILSGDSFDVTLGVDYDFNNVTSRELVSTGSPRTFSGQNSYNTNLRLFDEDKSWTLAIDYQFMETYNSSNVDKVLISCADENNGFRIVQRANGPVIYYGGNYRQLQQTNAYVSTSYYPTERDIIVIRHKKGDNNLYIYYSDISHFFNSPTEITMSRTGDITSNALLCFGAQVSSSDGYAYNYCSGNIFWAKLWEEDLGADRAKDLAMWTRDTLTFEVTGLGSSSTGTKSSNFRIYKKSGTDVYAGITFLMKNTMRRTMPMHYNNNGDYLYWDASIVRAVLNDRVYNAMPHKWKILIPRVDVNYYANGTLKTTSDYLYLPCLRDVNTNNGTGTYAVESPGTIDLYAGSATRIKYLDNGDGSATTYWLRTHYSSTYYYYYYVSSSGGTSYTYGSYSYGICFGFSI